MRASPCLASLFSVKRCFDGSVQKKLTNVIDAFEACPSFRLLRLLMNKTNKNFLNFQERKIIRKQHEFTDFVENFNAKLINEFN